MSKKWKKTKRPPAHSYDHLAHLVKGPRGALFRYAVNRTKVKRHVKSPTGRIQKRVKQWHTRLYRHVRDSYWMAKEELKREWRQKQNNSLTRMSYYKNVIIPLRGSIEEIEALLMRP